MRADRIDSLCYFFLFLRRCYLVSGCAGAAIFRRSSRRQRAEREKAFHEPTDATSATAGKARARRRPARRASALRSFLSKDSRITFENPTNQMPPYTSKAVPDQDLADIYAYLKSIPMPPKGKDIPLLNK